MSAEPRPDAGVAGGPHAALLRAIGAIDAHLFFPVRESNIIALVRPLVEGCKRMIDIGCSTGSLSSQLARSVGSQVFGADVHVQDRVSIPVVKYAGRLPFRDKSFDCALLIDVLHHADDPKAVLAQACRVAKTVVVKDHYYTGPLSHSLLKASDYLGNAPYGIQLPYHFLTLKEWGELFADAGLEVDYVSTDLKVFPLDPLHHILAKLSG